MLPQQRGPLALAIDIGSSSVRTVAFDAAGHQLPGIDHRERYRPEITADGGSMCDPLRIRALTAKCVRKCCEKLGEALVEVQVVGISCHWHSLLGLNDEGSPITPVYMWSDKRSSEEAFALATEVDPVVTHLRTGCRIHSSYWPAKLRWLKRERAEVADRVTMWCGLSDWLLLAPGVPMQTSISMASATGLMNTATMCWDNTLMQHIGIDVGQLPAIVDRTTPIPIDLIHPDLVPAGLNATWYQAIGDGAAANIGAGAIGKDRIALTIGTSGAIRFAGARNPDADLPHGLFRYLIDEETEVIGGALSNGGNMMNWFGNLSGMNDPKIAMRAAAEIAPDSHGLTVLPFFAGERAPSWQDSLRGTITGMNLDTAPVAIYRALLEATALRFYQVYADLLTFAAPEHEIMASGGALLQSPLWCQITADALGHSITALPTRLEASARGAAVSSLQAAGIIASLRVAPDTNGAFAPSEAAHIIYRRARSRLEALERALTIWEQETHNDG
ncbi:MAG: hypothetical protein KC435_11955 [Thermomicrobiales bacterium]|nr:hypothetical protein [Thermomicrobiales bacterium]